LELEPSVLKNAGMFSAKYLNFFDGINKDIDILDDMGVSKLSANVFFFKSELLL